MSKTGFASSLSLVDKKQKRRWLVVLAASLLLWLVLVAVLTVTQSVAHAAKWSSSVQALGSNGYPDISIVSDGTIGISGAGARAEPQHSLRSHCQCSAATYPAKCKLDPDDRHSHH
jgi:hypothetical protein